MTIFFKAEPDHRLDLTRQALRLTAAAWDDGFTAAIGHDLTAARRVMRGAPARRSALRTAHQQLQWSEPGRGPAVPRRATPADVVADLVRINRLLEQLSQTILAAPDATPLADGEQVDAETARRIGTSRLRYFAEALPRPAIDRHYIDAGHELLDALSRLAARGSQRGSTPDVCLALTIVLVETSRHATGIA